MRYKPLVRRIDRVVSRFRDYARRVLACVCAVAVGIFERVFILLSAWVTCALVDYNSWVVGGFVFLVGFYVFMDIVSVVCAVGIWMCRCRENARDASD